MLYSYKGPVMVDDNCLKNSWSSETIARNKTEAYNNFVMKCKRTLEDVYGMNIKVTLPGRLNEVKS